MKIQVPRLGLVETWWLWLSFQRYALLLALLAGAPLAAAAAVTGEGWWSWAAWVVAGLLALRLAAGAYQVGRRGPAKLHTLRVALHRIRRGDFSPDRIRRHCGDPCFRVVARESLRRAGFGPAERRRIVAAYARELRDEGTALIVIDHLRGEVRQTVGGQTLISSLSTPAPSPAQAP